MRKNIQPDGRILKFERPDFPWEIEPTRTADNRKLWPDGRLRPVPDGYDIPMARHHIIPADRLWPAWNALVNSECWLAIEAWIGTWGLGPDPRDQVRRMRKKELRFDECVAMDNKLVWAQYNLFEGPQHRTERDDPGNEFDGFPLWRVGSALRSRLPLLRDMFEIIRDWKSDQRDIGADDDKLLARLLNKLRAYSNSEIMVFEPKLWRIVYKGRFTGDGRALVLDGHGKIVIKHPTWEKNI